MSEQQWFAVRQVFHHVDRGLYEERITLWEASTFEQAHELARQEGEVYATGDDAVVVPARWSEAFHLFDPPASGREVFSDMRESELDCDEYVRAFFNTGYERTRERMAPADH
jgi:hypothetical protein